MNLIIELLGRLYQIFINEYGTVLYDSIILLYHNTNLKKNLQVRFRKKTYSRTYFLVYEVCAIS